MSRQMMNASRFGAGALAVVIAVVSSATCLAAGLNPPRDEQRACCAAMADGCGSPTTASKDCCTAEQPGQNQTVPLASTIVSPPAASATVILRQAAVPLGVPFAFDPDVSHTLSPSTYLLDSVFRI